MIGEVEDGNSPKNMESERDSTKRSVPPATEKVSPVKKAFRPDAPDSADAMPMDSSAKTADSEETPLTTQVTQQVLSVAPEPATSPAPDAALRDSLLQKALEKIEQLESRLAEQVAASQKAGPPSNQTSFVTPAPKHKHPSPTTSSYMESSTAASGREETPSIACASHDGDELQDDAKTSAEDENGDDENVIRFPNGAGSMSHDALRMRLRRLCEQKPKTKKCHVDEKTREQYVRGGEDREWLEIALVEALQKVGPDRSQHKKLKVARCNCMV